MTTRAMVPPILASGIAILVALFTGPSLRADLIALYKFDESTGGLATDTINANDAGWIPGTLSAPDWQPAGGLIGGAARFPGIGSHQNYFAIAGFPELNGTPAGMTIATWFKPEGNSGWRGIVTSRSVNNNVFGFGHEDDHLDGRVDGSAIDSLSGTLPANGAWFHVAWTWDNIAQTQRLYINGAPAGSATPVDAQAITSNSDWRIGDDACCDNRNLDGLLDDLAIWDEALTTAEISTLYTNGLAGYSANQTPPPPVTDPLNVGLVINEVHYDPNPKTDFVEFVELLNTGPDPIDLSGYQFTEGIDFTFPPGTTLGVTEYLVLAENPAFLASSYQDLPQVFQYPGSLNNEGETLVLRDAATSIVDRVEYRAEFPWPVTANGDGASMQLINATLDNDLGGSWRPALPTPGLPNHTFADNAPPQMRQVDHTPRQPASTQATTISIKATDPDGVATMTLHYQVNAPGSYLPAFLPLPSSTVNSSPGTPLPPNPAFEDPANWISIPMAALPLEPDRYEATIPAQAHRALVRYRVTATDPLGNSIRAPFPDDPSLNFAYFSYDGVPPYTADLDSVHPDGVGHTYPSEILTSIPVYHLITHPDHLAHCWAYDSGDRVSLSAAPRSKFNWEGALVYDNKVYDHVSYRLRQRNDRYAGAGRRSMRFRFRRGNYFQARDPAGKQYPVKWRSMNTGKMSRFAEAANHGMRELVSSRLWNLAGVVAPDFQHVHFRVIDNAAEASDQYHGDFYGLALVFEDVDAQFIKARKLPRGNIYKLKDGESNPLELQKYQARQAVGDGSDFINIRDNLGPPTQSDQWLREHVDWDSWYLYAALGEGFRHYDFAPYHQKNRIWHFKPDPVNPLGLMSIIPHDTDATWKRGTNDNQWDDPRYGPGPGSERGRVVGIDLPKEAIQEITGLDESDGENHPERPAFMLEYRNVIREVRDLLWQPETVNTVIDQAAATIAEFSLADRDRWDKGPADAGSENIGPLEDQVAIMKSLAFTEDLYMGSSLVGGRAQWLTNLAVDPAIPNTPVISYTGPQDHPTGLLAFDSSTFSDPDGADTFAAMEWRIAEVNPPAGPIVPVLPFGSIWKYLDDGSNQGTAWQDPLFDDSTWASGPAQFGYGEGDEATVVGFGPDPDNKFRTTYFRKTFHLTDAAALGDLRMTVYRDDGVVVHLNGAQIYSNNMPTSGVTYLSFASGNATGDGDTPVSTVVPNFLFLEGPNTLAVEIHQQSASSSDISFDLSLAVAPPLPADPLHEWHPTWESGILGSFHHTTTVPALATREGHRYRARVRHRDNSGRWSHWSAPHEFVAGAADVTIYRDALVVSEVMYHPATPTTAEILAGYDDDDFFEFVEIQNIGSQTLDLTDIRFTKGINFNFFNSAITTLAPGEFALVVNNVAAFEMRYGPGLPVAGEYTNAKFDNGGENVKLSFGAGIPLQEFTYDDLAPWPVSPDGTGPSLILNAPWSSPDHTDPSNWRPSLFSSGSPGMADLTAFTGDPHADLDGDGLAALVEYGLGTSDEIFDSAPLQLALQPNGNLTLSFSENPYAGDISTKLQVSSDLVNWQNAGPDYALTKSINHGNGTATTTVTLHAPLPSGPLFHRLAVSQLP